MNALTNPSFDLPWVCTQPQETALEAAHRITGRNDCGSGPMAECATDADPLEWPPRQPQACPIPWGWEDCATLDAEDEGDDFALYEGDFDPYEDELAEMERNYWRDVLPRHLHR